MAMQVLVCSNTIHFMKQRLYYLCTCKNLVAHFWVKDDTTLLNQEVEKNTGENDSLARKEFFRESNYTGVDFIVISENEVNVNRKRILLHADTLYSFNAHMPLQDVELPDYKKMFNSFHPVTTTANTSTIFERKPAKLLEALRSTDSVVFDKAYTALKEVDFGAGDLRLLMKALLQWNKDFDRT